MSIHSRCSNTQASSHNRSNNHDIHRANNHTHRTRHNKVLLLRWGSSQCSYLRWSSNIRFRNQVTRHRLLHLCTNCNPNNRGPQIRLHICRTIPRGKVRRCRDCSRSTRPGRSSRNRSRTSKDYLFLEKISFRVSNKLFPKFPVVLLTRCLTGAQKEKGENFELK